MGTVWPEAAPAAGDIHDNVNSRLRTRAAIVAEWLCVALQLFVLRTRSMMSLLIWAKSAPASFFNIRSTPAASAVSTRARARSAKTENTRGTAWFLLSQGRYLVSLRPRNWCCRSRFRTERMEPLGGFGPVGAQTRAPRQRQSLPVRRAFLQSAWRSSA